MLIDIDDDVPYDFALADDAKTQAHLLSEVLDAAALGRENWRQQALEDFAGAFAHQFAADGIVDLADTQELVSALLMLSNNITDLSYSARAEQDRREQARLDQTDADCAYSPVVSPTGLAQRSVFGEFCQVPMPAATLTFTASADLRPRGSHEAQGLDGSSVSSARVETLASYVANASVAAEDTRRGTARLCDALQDFSSLCRWGAINSEALESALYAYCDVLDAEVAWIDRIRELFFIAGSESNGISSIANAHIVLANAFRYTPSSALMDWLLRTSDPSEVAAMFHDLPQKYQQLFIHDHPDILRNLDGIPPQIRDSLNREYLTTQLASFEELIASGKEYDQAVYEDLLALRTVLDRADSYSIEQGESPSFLLLLDTTGRQTKAAVAYGDVTTADHVQVFVPGFTTTVRNNFLSHFEEMRLLAFSEESILEKDSTDTVATVTWFGYDMPQWSQTLGENSVANDAAALEGASKLRSFTSGLKATGISSINITLLGHSYGSIICLFAIQVAGHQVNNVITMGNPGLPSIDNHVNAMENLAFSPTTGLLIDGLAALTGPGAFVVKGTRRGTKAVHKLATDGTVVPLFIDEGHIFHLGADFDPVDDLEYFGPDLSDVDGVTELSTDNSESGHGIWGHSRYLEDHSTSQHNIAAISIGRFGVSVPGNSTGLGDWALNLNPKDFSIVYEGNSNNG